MNIRLLIILTIFIAISFGGFWLIRTPNITRSPETIDTLIVGTNAEFPPFSHIENDTIVGFDIDVIQELAKRLDKKITFRDMSFEALIPELQLGNIHVIAAGMTPTEERAKRVFFSTPHLTGDSLMAIQKKDAEPITTPQQLHGKRVAVNQGYTADQYVTSLDIPTIDIVRLSSSMISTGLLALNSNQADVFIAAKNSLLPLVKQRENYTLSPIENTAESSAIAISKKYPNLFTTIQTTIDAMIKDGTIDSLKKKWNLND